MSDENPTPSAEAESGEVKQQPQMSERRRKLYRTPVIGAILYLIAPPKTKPHTVWRRALSWTTTLVILLGVGMVGYPWAGDRYPFFYRVPVEKMIEWSNILSDLQTNDLQSELAAEFASANSLPDLLADGDPLTQIVIPKIGLDTIVVEGTSPSALKAGAGHYPETPLPGEQGNVAIAGHRTTFGRPFNKVDALRTGDEIHLRTPLGVYTYTLTRDPWITNPSDWTVIDQPPDKSVLTLTACHPKGSARQRIIVRAELTREELR